MYAFTESFSMGVSPDDLLSMETDSLTNFITLLLQVYYFQSRVSNRPFKEGMVD